jgi:enoyl-CoA hydratase/carnithine racemase
MSDTTTKQILLTRRTPAYWRVTFNHPPLNIFGPEAIPQLNEIITALETDEHVKVVVFDSAVEGFFLTHYDFLAKLEDTTSLPPGPTGLQPLPDALVRLSRAPAVSIASIRGRATGVGSELALACDMRFASREKAIFSQWEVGAGIVPGGGPMARLPRLMGRGRELEVLLGADDIPGRTIRVRQPVISGFRPRRLCRGPRNPYRIVRQAGDQRDQALRRRSKFAA